MKFIFDSGKASKSGRTNPESVAGFNRNTRQLSTGIGGRFAPDFPIKLAMRESDILSRLGGDEFLLIFPDCRLQEVKSIWRRVEASLKERNSDSSVGFKISASYGFAETNSEKSLSCDEILQIADTRMYNHKRRIKRKVK